jgi:hypothetical protein
MTGYKLHVEWWTLVEHTLDLPAYTTVIGSLNNQQASALVMCYVSWEICTKSTEANLLLNQEYWNRWLMV